MPDLVAVYTTPFSTKNVLAFHLHENAVARQHWTPLTFDVLIKNKKFSFPFHRRKKCIHVWNDKRVSLSKL